MAILGYAQNGQWPARVTFDSREAASDAFNVLQTLQTDCATRIRAIDRKRSLSDSEKAMAAGRYRRQLETLQKLAQAIGEAYSIGGY
jgi:hypothetical protein